MSLFSPSLKKLGRTEVAVRARAYILRLSLTINWCKTSRQSEVGLTAKHENSGVALWVGWTIETD